jgi:hypothetical protein
MKSRKEIEKHTQKSLQLSMSFQKEDSAKEVIEFWRAQQQAPTIADSLDVNPLYRYWRDTIHKTGKVLKDSAIETIEFYSSMNPALKKWYDDMAANWSFIDPSILKDYFMNGWYIPAGLKLQEDIILPSNFFVLQDRSTSLQESYLGQHLANSLISLSIQITCQDLTTNTMRRFHLKEH